MASPRRDDVRELVCSSARQDMALKDWWRVTNASCSKNEVRKCKDQVTMGGSKAEAKIRLMRLSAWDSCASVACRLSVVGGWAGKVSGGQEKWRHKAGRSGKQGV